MPSCPDQREPSQTEYQSTRGLPTLATKKVPYFLMKSETEVFVAFSHQVFRRSRSCCYKQLSVMSAGK